MDNSRAGEAWKNVAVEQAGKVSASEGEDKLTEIMKEVIRENKEAVREQDPDNALLAEIDAEDEGA